MQYGHKVWWVYTIVSIIQLIGMLIHLWFYVNYLFEYTLVGIGAVVIEHIPEDKTDMNVYSIEVNQ